MLEISNKMAFRCGVSSLQVHFPRPQIYTHIWIFGMKKYNLATLSTCRIVKRQNVEIQIGDIKMTTSLGSCPILT
jgi:hypothetical protein